MANYDYFLVHPQFKLEDFYVSEMTDDLRTYIDNHYPGGLDEEVYESYIGNYCIDADPYKTLEEVPLESINKEDICFVMEDWEEYVIEDFCDGDFEWYGETEWNKIVDNAIEEGYKVYRGRPAWF